MPRPSREQILAHIYKHATGSTSNIQQWREKYANRSEVLDQIISWQEKHLSYAAVDPVQIAEFDQIFEADERMVVCAGAALERELTPIETFELADIGRLVGARSEIEWKGPACAALSRLQEKLARQ